MLRSFLTLVVALALVAASCSSGAATSRADLGSGEDDASNSEQDTASASANANTELPTATAVAVVVEPTPTPVGPLPLQVVTLLGETGIMEGLDRPALAGVVAEIDRINQDGGLLGRQITLIRHDTNSRNSTAERIMMRLLDNPPDLVIVSCDTEFSEPVLKLADSAGIITMSPCASDPRYLTGALGSRNFSMGAPAGSQGELAAQLGLDRFGNTALVLRDVTNPEALAFCDGFERAFRELGGSVAYRDEFSYDTLEPVQDRLAERDRNVAFITVCSAVPGDSPTELDGAPNIINMFRSLGFDAPIVAGSTVDEPQWFASVPVLGEMVFVTWSSIYGNDPDERVNDLVQRVRSVSDPLEDPLAAGVSTILGAESIEAWTRAVIAADSASPDRVAAALGSFQNEQFATGPVSFVSGARMDLGRQYRVLEIIDGELSVIALETTND